MGEFGDTFRKEREKKGISLEDVSSVTKISSRMLRAIEEEHFDQLPGGVFNKGFIRTYAKHLGLNDDEAVASYLACIRREQLDAQATWDLQASNAGQGAPDRRGTKSPRPQEELPGLQLPRAEHVAPLRREYGERRDGAIPWRILSLAILAVILAGILLHRHYGSARSQAGTGAAPLGASAAQVAPAPAISPAPIPTVSSPPRTSVAASTSLRPSVPTPSPTGTQLTTHLQATAPTKAPASAPSDITTKSVELLNSQPAVTPPATLTLVIRASEDSWISVSADGQSVLHETLIAPAHTTVRAERKIVLRVGNAAGVTFLWNGQEIPAQGAEAEVKTIVFDATGIQVLPPQQAPVSNP